MDDSAEQATPSLLYAVKQVELAVRSHLDDLLRPAGITALQYTALTVLQRGQDVTAAQLARNSFVTTQSMSDLVTALERRKLISRARDTVDRRRITLSLTPAGEQLLADQAEAVADLEARMVADLSAADVTAFRKALNASRAALVD